MSARPILVKTRRGVKTRSTGTGAPVYLDTQVGIYFITSAIKIIFIYADNMITKKYMITNASNGVFSDATGGL